MAYETMSVRMPGCCKDYLQRIVDRGDAKNASNALIMIVIERMEKEERNGPRPFKTEAPRDARKPRRPSQRTENGERTAPRTVKASEAPRDPWGPSLSPDLSGWTEEQKRVFYNAHPELEGKR